MITRLQDAVQQLVQAHRDAGGKDDIAGVITGKEIIDLCPRAIDQLFRFLGTAIASAAGVGAAGSHKPGSGFNHLRRFGKTRRRIVKIDSLHGLPLFF